MNSIFSIFFFLLFLTTIKTDQPDPPYGKCFYDGLTMADPSDSTAYFVCCDHFWLLKHCPYGELFDQFNLTCIHSSPHPLPSTVRYANPSTKIPLFCTPGDRIANPFDNTKFDECVNGTHYETRQCLSGFVFNPITKQCQFLPTTSACPRGEIRPAIGYPDDYYYCNGQVWILMKCPQGMTFDPYRNQCVPKIKPPTATTRGSTRRPSTTRIPFGTCQESSGQNGFRPNPDDCRTYFQCVHSQWMKRDCGPGTQWRQSILGCDYYYGTCDAQ